MQTALFLAKCWKFLDHAARSARCKVRVGFVGRLKQVEAVQLREQQQAFQGEKAAADAVLETLKRPFKQHVLELVREWASQYSMPLLRYKFLVPGPAVARALLQSRCIKSWPGSSHLTYRLCKMMYRPIFAASIVANTNSWSSTTSTICLSYSPNVPFFNRTATCTPLDRAKLECVATMSIFTEFQLSSPLITLLHGIAWSPGWQKTWS